ncbi:MAG: site-2 protease family protein [Chlamydiales bacterium]|nr:site-2 protease family protein [Chlamydiales bacterium]
MKRIPIRISPAFFITAGLIGFLSSFSFLGTLIWIGIIFVSVLFHEYGHALSSMIFGQSPSIELVAFGGVTIPKGPSLPLWKEFIVVFCGPLFGFCLFLISFFLIREKVFSHLIVVNILEGFKLVNLFWTIINLLPVLPLDGGQLMRIIIEGIFGIKGRRYALIVSMVLAIVVALGLFLWGAIIVGALFFLFAFQNFEIIKQTKGITETDANTHLREEIIIGEHQLLSGNTADAKRHFEEILSQAKEGVIHKAASEYLAQIYAKDGDNTKAYELLTHYQSEELSDPSKCLLHQLSFEHKDYQRVLDLAGTCFQEFPSLELAKRTVIAAAKLNDIKATIGWMKTCIHYGLEEWQEFIKDPAFDTIRSVEEFNKFIDKHK